MAGDREPVAAPGAETEGPEGVALVDGEGKRPERLALWILQAGVVAVVLVASTNRAFELDRFFVPKELVLHATAALAGVLAVRTFRRASFTSVDLFLVGFLILSAASALLAPERDLAIRALSITVSGVAVFWAARALRDAGLSRPLLVALALAVVLGAATSLLQTYGVRTDLFSLNRAPGGTLGNRNFVAHLAAFGLPLVLLSALRAWRGAGYLIGTAGVMLVVATLVLTRSRAGWLAFAAVVAIFLLGLLASRPLRRHGRTWLRLAGILALAAAGVAGALALPNALRWRSANPYVESVRGVVNYREGSGRGRLVQYETSLRMAATRPLLGVGPGNWPVAYPEHAAPGDPSLSVREPGTTANPWPSSDWIAFVSERGIPAAFLLALALAGIARAGAARLVRARDPDEGLVATALLATVTATVVAGAFDAVLLLGHPTLIVWAALGVLFPPELGRSVPLPRWAGAGALALLALAAALSAGRSVLELGRMASVAANGPCAERLRGGDECATARFAALPWK